MEGVLCFIIHGANAVRLSIFRKFIGYEDIIFTPYFAEAHKTLLLRTAGAGAALNDRGAAEKNKL